MLVVGWSRRSSRGRKSSRRRRELGVVVLMVAEIENGCHLVLNSL